MKKTIFVLLFMMFRVFAEDIPPNLLNGNWIRVADGCHQVSNEQKKRLADSGGWNGMQRRMQLYIENGEFTSVAMRSFKCDKDFQLSGPDLIAERLYCGNNATNHGSVTFTSAEKMILVATDPIDGDNPWGIQFRFWDFDLDGDVLLMKSTQPECDSGEYNVYFIRVPMS